jgi:hypothetical protein
MWDLPQFWFENVLFAGLSIYDCRSLPLTMPGYRIGNSKLRDTVLFIQKFLLYYQNFGSQFTLTSAAKSQAISARRISSTSAGTNA